MPFEKTIPKNIFQKKWEVKDILSQNEEAFKSSIQKDSEKLEKIKESKQNLSVPDLKANKITVANDIQEPLTIDDLIHVINGSNASYRLKRTFLKTIKYRGNLRRAAREEGYSPGVYNNPQKIMEQKGWVTLVDHYFPKDALMKKEKELWKQKDWRAWANSLDRLHKIRGSFIKRVEHNIHRVEEFRQMDDNQLKKIIDADYEEINDGPGLEPGSGQEETKPLPDESEEGNGYKGDDEKETG